MKTIIGTLRLYPPKRLSGRTLEGYLCKAAIAILGKEVVFDIEHNLIRRAGMFDNHPHSTKNRTFTFTPKDGNLEYFVGVYNIIQRNEDIFTLKRIKDA